MKRRNTLSLLPTPNDIKKRNSSVGHEKDLKKKKSDFGGEESSGQPITPNTRRRWFGLVSPRSKDGSSSTDNQLGHSKESLIIYLQQELPICVAAKGRKPRQYKPCEITVSDCAISFSNALQTMPMSSICTLQRSATPKLSSSSRVKPPSIDIDAAEVTLLICNDQLTRVWIQFTSKLRCLEWLITIDCILTKYGRSLYTPELKVKKKKI